jgi:hypothetical protein
MDKHNSFLSPSGDNCCGSILTLTIHSSRSSDIWCVSTWTNSHIFWLLQPFMGQHMDTCVYILAHPAGCRSTWTLATNHFSPPGAVAPPSTCGSPRTMFIWHPLVLWLLRPRVFAGQQGTHTLMLALSAICLCGSTKDLNDLFRTLKCYICGSCSHPASSDAIIVALVAIPHPPML